MDFRSNRKNHIHLYIIATHSTYESMPLWNIQISELGPIS